MKRRKRQAIFTAGEVAEMAGVDRRTIIRRIGEGRLRGVKAGKKYRITEASVRAFLGLTAREPLPKRGD